MGKLLLDSGSFKNLDQYLENTQTAYFSPPFHNFMHGKSVFQALQTLQGNTNFTPEAAAALNHDACHTGHARPPFDEQISVKINTIILRGQGFDKEYIEQSNEAIIGTLFSDRANIQIHQQRLLADADLSALGGNYQNYIKNAVLFFLETQKFGDISNTDIVDFFQNTQPQFFNHLTDITGRKETPYLTEEGRSHFPHFIQNKDQVAQDIEEKPEKLIDVVRKYETLPHIQAFRSTQV